MSVIGPTGYTGPVGATGAVGVELFGPWEQTPPDEIAKGKPAFRRRKRGVWGRSNKLWQYSRWPETFAAEQDNP